MKLLLPVFILGILFTSCKKSHKTTTLTNCDNLVTDTLGTGDNGRIYFANAFTPNGDGLNDLSGPIIQNIATLTFSVYDANNNIIFTTSTAPYTWVTSVGNNTSVTYYYRIQATTNSNHHIGFCGTLYKLSCFPASVPKSSLHFEDQLTPFGFTGVTAEALPNCP